MAILIITFLFVYEKGGMPLKYSPKTWGSPLTHRIQSTTGPFGMGMRESIPKQVDKSGDPQGERSLEFSRRRKGQTVFFFFSLYIPQSQSHKTFLSLNMELMTTQLTTQFGLCTKDLIAACILLAKMGSIKGRNAMDLTEAEDIKMRWQEYTEELCRIHSQIWYY